MSHNHTSRAAAAAALLTRRWFAITLVALGGLVLSLGIARAARASASSLHRYRRPPAAIKLSKDRLVRARGFICGNVHGRWIRGTMVAPGYFRSDGQQAHVYSMLARHASGRARRVDLARAKAYRQRARKGQPLCGHLAAKARSRAGAATARTSSVPGRGTTIASPSPPASPPPPVSSEPTYIPAQFFGQHLMFNWGLTPAIPVHAMRLWDSNASWCDIDKGTTANQYNFGQLDALLAQATRLGADVEYTFGSTPAWAAAGSYPQPSGTNQCSSSSQTMAPASESYWTNFVTALATHAKGRIHAYELWNEVDYSGYWSGGMSTMVQMSVDAANIIHRIDPAALVLSPSITANSGGYAFLRQYLSLLPPGTIDAIAIHSYTAGAWPEGFIPAEMSAVRSALPSAYVNAPIWSTEGGWALDSQFSSSASDQRAFVARYDLQLLSQGVARSYWYAYQNGAWGTLWDGSALTPAGIATGTLNAWLSGATLTGCRTGDGNLWTCNLTTSAGASARIVWVTHTPVPNYPTSGYTTVAHLDGSSSPAGGAPITVTTEPVLLTS